MSQLEIEQTFQSAIGQHQAGRLTEAESLYRQILAQEPQHAGALHYLGVLCQQTGRSDIAVNLIRQALAIQPGNAAAHCNLGNALRDLGQLDEAIAACRQAIVLNPSLAVAFNNLGNAFQDKRQSEEAIAAFRQCIVLTPRDPKAYNNLGNALQTTRRLDEAIVVYRQAIALQPNLAESYSNLGAALKDTGQLDQAIAAYRQAIALSPADASLHSNLLFVMHYHPGYDAQAIARETAVWNRQHAEPLKRFIRPHENDRNPDRRLRIGLVSPDYRDHPAARTLLRPLLENYDKSQFDFFAYAQVLAPDAMTQRLRSLVDQWRSTVGLSDAQAADLIRQDKIDILVDFAMHTAHNRLPVFAHKPAPVQVTWFPSTTSMQTMDYRVTDRFIDPPGAEEPYTEQSIRLQSFWCFQPRHTAEVNALPALKNGYITIGSLNNFAKINPDVLRLWIRIMQAIPNSRLLLKSDPGSHLKRVEEIFKAGGISSERLEFVGKISEQDYFQLYHRIDLGLDPFPFNGHTTTFDCLWMGVPVITLSGKTGVGRAGVSALSNIGLMDLITGTTDEYVERAVRLANDLPALSNLRSTLRQRMLASPLMDAPGYARDIETAFRNIWRQGRYV